LNKVVALTSIFCRVFSQGEPVSGLETVQSRIVVKELEEPNWWVVAVCELIYGLKIFVY
jgi:hypothetical protein